MLDTTELLECVLSHLPPKQIFGVQRVASLWRDVIARSLGIQEKLFLKLQHKPAELWALLECARHAEFEGRKLRLEKITSEFDVKSVSATDATLFMPVALNPFLQLGTTQSKDLFATGQLAPEPTHSLPRSQNLARDSPST